MDKKICISDINFSILRFCSHYLLDFKVYSSHEENYFLPHQMPQVIKLLFTFILPNFNNISHFHDTFSFFLRFSVQSSFIISSRYCIHIRKSLLTYCKIIFEWIPWQPDVTTSLIGRRETDDGTIKTECSFNI